MNFSTHKKKLIDSIKLALSKGKVEMIDSFKPIFGTANSLFKTDRYNFWLKQIGQIEYNEIPVTHYGLKEAKDILNSLMDEMPSSKSLDGSLYSICECLFTYSSDNDMCQFQSDFHYYFHIPNRIVFKESELGMVVPQIKIDDISEIRIAKVSELDINSMELSI